jgi:DNA-binding response OmpR family regulator
MSIKSTPSNVSEILIVDDVKENCFVLKTILERIGGYRTRVCYDGCSALQAVEDSQPDLILLDIMMPGMNGYDVCRHLKAQPLSEAIPVIFMSNLDRWDDHVAAFMAGGIDFLAKPFYSQDVLSKIRAHLTSGAMWQKNETPQAADLVSTPASHKNILSLTHPPVHEEINKQTYSNYFPNLGLSVLAAFMSGGK